MKLTPFLVAGCLFFHISTCAQANPATARQSEDQGKVVASGSVPDEASRAAILARLRELYGTQNVVDRLEVGGVVPPPNWSENMTKI
ncbi:MAG: BON domain-containing protein, partial [Dechloromonas sp.]|nr:BON domain-containing protein [Dechloromonas sp.]